MNNENLQYLADNIKYMGFGENLKPELEKNISQGKTEFHLSYKAEINKKPFEATLNFRKSDSSDLYFFNSYQASLVRNSGDRIDQTFYLKMGKGVTAKEAFNLLDGRSVYKDLTNRNNEPYKAWLQLDLETKDKNKNFELKHYHENYGYDLRAALGNFAVAELKDPEKEKALIQSLQKGNVQSVTIEKDGNNQKMFIEANPQYKTINLYDAQMKRVQKESLGQFQKIEQYPGKDIKKEEQQEVKKDEKKSVKQGPDSDLNGSKKKSTRKKGMSV